MQLQLEVCDLDECDFLEMSIKEYSNRDEFIEDSDDNDTRMRKDGNYKGCLIECRRENTKSWDYHYIDYKKSLEDQLIEIEDIADMLMDKYDDILVLKKTYWRVEKYSCVRVYRDKIWFSEALEKMKQCWDKVLFFRKYGIEKIIKLKMPNNFLEMTEKELIEYIEKDRLEKLNKQNNKINKKSIIRKRTSFNQKCLIEDSDDESEITNNIKKQENKKDNNKR